jgi:broad specificity phosphatase PhoE
VRRLLLVGHAPTSATRAGSFPADEPVDERGRAAAAALAAALPRRCDVVCGPERRCVETARAAGLGAIVDEALADCDYAAWSGRAVADLDAADGRAWRTDPDAAPHGGETLRAFAARVGAWLDEQVTAAGATVAITHAAVVRAAVVHALGTPLDTFWRLDIAPLSITELHTRDGGWSVVRLNAPAAPRTAWDDLAPPQDARSSHPAEATG